MESTSNKQDSNSLIRIYPSFTEIRQHVEAVTPHQLYFSQDCYNQIMPGSLNIEGVNVTSMNAVLRENNLEGKTIVINKDKEKNEVRMIRSRDNLVQDLKTNRYYHVDRSHIEFLEVPEETGTEITFTLEKNGPGVLSYLMYAISWKPRYSLNINGDSYTLQGWADIKNNTQKEYTVNKTELFGGDVAINQHHDNGCRPVMMMRMAKSAPAPRIQAQGEVAGLYMYSIDDGYVLAPRSTFSLPFVAPAIELKKIASLTSYFSNSNNKGQSSRVYKVKSPEFLPNGSVTVREDGRVVGQSNIPDLSANEFTDLSVGNDPEVSYERSVKTLEHNENTSDYDVVVTVKNKKSRTINYEFTEQLHGRYEVEKKSDNLMIENDYVKSEGTLPASSDVQLKFRVRFFYKENVIIRS